MTQRACRPGVLSQADTHAWKCLGTTNDGSPRHPLFVKADAPLVPWDAAAWADKAAAR